MRHRLVLVLATFLASVTGGHLLVAGIAQLSADSFFAHGRGTLAALLVGSAIGFLVNRKASTWRFRQQANLPWLAIAADVATLFFAASATSSRFAAWAVFLLLCVRWSGWSSSRSVRTAAARSLGLAVHYAEGAAFLGLAIGSVVPFIAESLSRQKWAPDLPALLVVDIALFLVACALDHWNARAVDTAKFYESAKKRLPAWDNITPAARENTFRSWLESSLSIDAYLDSLQSETATSRDSAPTSSGSASSVVETASPTRVMGVCISLTIATQMVLFAYLGAIKKLSMGGLLGSLLIPSVYFGAAIGALLGGIGKAALRFREDGNTHLRLWNREILGGWVYIAAVLLTAVVLWSPQELSIIAAIAGAAALVLNTVLFTSALTLIGGKFGAPRLVRALGAYFPLAIGGYVVLSLLATEVLLTPSAPTTASVAGAPTVRIALSSVLVVGLGCALMFTYGKARRDK